MKRAAAAFLMAIATCLTAGGAGADTDRLTYEFSGTFASIGGKDVLGLDGASFRLNVTIDPDSKPSEIKRHGQRQVGIYDSVKAVLHLSSISNRRLNGAYRGTHERLEVIDTIGGDFCLSVDTRFETPNGVLSPSTVCFAPKSGTGTELPTGLKNADVIGFHTWHSGPAAYGVSQGSVTRGGGAK